MVRVDIYLESAPKRVFACAIDWPGWARSGRDEDAAIATFIEYAERYGRAIGSTVPTDEVDVVETVTGSPSTDFGVPAVVLRRDSRPFDDTELSGQRAILGACWNAFDAAVSAVGGVDLRTGPRGGGRNLNKMVAHVIDSEAAYVKKLGGVLPHHEDERFTTMAVHEAFEVALEGRIRGEVSAEGIRGARWPPRYAIRRAAWHALDHAWELEDRAQSDGRQGVLRHRP